MSISRAKVLLADDHPLLLAGLIGLLEHEFDIVGTATDGRSLLANAAELAPELVIVDISLPDFDGIEATRRLLAALPGVRVLILSLHSEPSYVRAAFEAGAAGYLTKASAPDEIETAVREVLAGRYYLSPMVARGTLLPSAEHHRQAWHGLERPAVQAPDRLTRREGDIVRLLALGLANKEIAQRLSVSVATVRTHLSNAYEKLGLGSRVALALYGSQTHDLGH